MFFFFYVSVRYVHHPMVYYLLFIIFYRNLPILKSISPSIRSVIALADFTLDLFSSSFKSSSSDTVTTSSLSKTSEFNCFISMEPVHVVISYKYFIILFKFYIPEVVVLVTLSSKGPSEKGHWIVL